MKKARRLENRKAKMIGLLEVAKLNEADRLLNLNKFRETLLSGSASESADDEPSLKRVRLSVEIGASKDTVSDAAEMTDKDGNKDLKAQMREYKKRRRHVPKFKFKAGAEHALLSLEPGKRIPLFLSDVQSLVLFATQGCTSLYTPRWCHVDKCSHLTQVVVVFVEGLSLAHYTQHRKQFTRVNNIFRKPFELVTPVVYRGDLVGEFCTVPLTSTQRGKVQRNYGTLQNAVVSAAVFPMTRAAFPVQEGAEETHALDGNACAVAVHDAPAQDALDAVPDKALAAAAAASSGADRFPRTFLLMSAAQLVEEDYPIPLAGFLSEKYRDYVATRDTYAEVTASSPMFGLDCEMCRTSANLQELTRVSVVNERHEVVYEQLVLPDNPITDYLTRFSGITKKMMHGVTTKLRDVQRDLRALLPPDAILVGQSLNFDLHALHMMHPYVIDTSLVFNVTGVRGRKSKLQVLARQFLHEDIQNSGSGHCSVEDSLSSLKLVQLKLRHSLEFGDAVLSARGPAAAFYYGSSLLHHVVRHDRSVAVVADADTAPRYGKFVHAGRADSARISTVAEAGGRRVARAALQALPAHFLTIVHLRPPPAADGEGDREAGARACAVVDRWLGRTWDALRPNSLCAVVFAGQPGANGVCFVKTKEAPADVGAQPS